MNPPRFWGTTQKFCGLSYWTYSLIDPFTKFLRSCKSGIHPHFWIVLNCFMLMPKFIWECSFAKDLKIHQGLLDNYFLIIMWNNDPLRGHLHGDIEEKILTLRKLVDLYWT